MWKSRLVKVPKNNNVPKFSEIKKPDFVGEQKTLSVKVPKSLRKVFEDHAKSNQRVLSEVVVHALTQYALYLQRSKKQIKG